MQHLDSYLNELRMIHSSGVGVPETSYYPALAVLLNEVGGMVQPRVHCILHPANRGAGIPDGGLFSSEQLRDDAARDPQFVIAPSRGVIEVKPTSEDIDEIAETRQVQDYLKHYGQVLVTNLRSFLLLGLDEYDEPVALERYDLAPDERSFWESAALPGQISRQHGERLTEHLKRVMLNPVALRDPKDVAWFLASYARDARSRIEHVELDALASLRAALEEALGLTFTDERGDHFFRSTLIQTLFYGVFSSWVLWHRERSRRPTERFDWRVADWSLHVPMIRALFHQIASPGYLQPLGLVEVLNWTAAALNRIDTAVFFERFQEAHAVQYFYEPFLQEFDPELRRQLGVWYTPPEIVEYMVERVDTVLREELDVPDGLADPDVYVLDPATGTGSYLVEVLKRIDKTLRERSEDALSAQRVKRAALDRVFGFEILPAPFVVAHLQLGLYLRTLGAPLDESERASVYLTNSLTGWRPPESPQRRLTLHELEEERDAAEHVKRDTPILVVIGNPPYSGFAGIAVDEERELTNAYRKAKRTRQPRGQGLNDLYVRFFGMADRKIVEDNGRGIVCYISNYSWLDGLSSTAMRERYLEVFDSIWVDNLHGDRIISEYAPDGRTSETVFATPGFSAGIKIGTAIALFARDARSPNSEETTVRYRDVDQARAAERRQALVRSLQQGCFSDQYELLEPVAELGFPFMPLKSAPNYLSWPLLPGLFPVSFPGVKTSRDDLLVDIDREPLVRRMEMYFDPSISNEELRRRMPKAMGSTARFQAEQVRDQLLERGFLPQNIVRYCYRPFDVRWLYWEPETKLLDEKRADYFPNVFEGNRTLVSQQKPRREWSRPQCIASIGCLDLMDRGASCFPMFVTATSQMSFFETSERSLNLSDRAGEYLGRIGASLDEPLLFSHAVGVLHASSYAMENNGALRQDWPRIPLPESRQQLEASSALGGQIVQLLDPEQRVEGVTHGGIRPELQVIGVVSTANSTPISPAAGDLRLDANWGYLGARNAVMPGGGKVEQRAYSDAEFDAIAQGAAALGLDVDVAMAKLGESTFDVYLNQRVFWRNVPEQVWEYTLGGYQVIKKWLSYREHDILGRSLTLDEVQEFTNIARRMAAILLLEPALDANYQAIKASTYPWPRIG